MKLHLPPPNLLETTGNVDYFHWNYTFPIKYIQRFRFKAILKLLGQTTYDRILEVGTGSGIFLPELSRHCNEIYAIDVHDRMSALDHLCKKLSIKASLCRCGIEETPFPDEFFDVIVAVSVLEFVGDLRKTILEIKRILKPNGFLATICPQQSPILDFILNLYTRRAPDEEFGNSREKVSDSLEEEFAIIQKNIFPPIAGKIIPVYNYYKLMK